MEYLSCAQREGLFWMVFNCQEEFYYVAECQEFEFYVEMDKRRRDMSRNQEKWWRELYDEQGEVGKQKATAFGELGLWDSVKLTFLGEEAVKDARYYYGKPDWFKG